MMLPRVSTTDSNTIVRVTASTPGAARNPTEALKADIQMTPCHPSKSSRTTAGPWPSEENQATVLQLRINTHPQIECRPLLYKTFGICWPCFSISIKDRRPFSSVDVGAVIQRCKQEDGRYKPEHDTRFLKLFRLACFFEWATPVIAGLAVFG